jgi:hypothetical protein
MEVEREKAGDSWITENPVTAKEVSNHDHTILQIVNLSSYPDLRICRGEPTSVGTSSVCEDWF